MARYCFQDVSVIAIVNLLWLPGDISSEAYAIALLVHFSGRWACFQFSLLWTMSMCSSVSLCALQIPCSKSSAVYEISIFFYILTHTWCCQTLIFVMMMGEKPYLSVFICIFTICLSSSYSYFFLGNFLFIFFSYIDGLFFFLIYRVLYSVWCKYLRFLSSFSLVLRS